MVYSYTLKSTSAISNKDPLSLLQSNFTMIRESNQQGIYYYFDTFDWRLYRQGYHLYLFNHSLYLYQFSKRRIEEKEEFRSSFNEKLVLRDGIVFRKIKPIIEIRILLCMATLRLSLLSFRLLNKDDKTILRILIEQSKIKDKTGYKNLNSHIELKPLRGYANQVSGVLKKLPPGDITVNKDDILKRGLAILGKKPVDYSSKLSIRLTNRMSAVEATNIIYYNLLEIIRKNEFGIVKDIDTEFLHDFRVAIRRTRSALGQIKGVLEENIVLKAKENFSFFGRSTNKLRDIDVYLLREEQYKMMVPMELTRYLNPFFEELREQRKTEHHSLVKLLNSAKYKRMLSEWKSHLKTMKIEDKKNTESVKDLAIKIIKKRNKKILNFGQKILITGSDDLLHQLRIEGKKLRYLLEFFQSLFSPEKIQILIRKLKLLQDNLGDYNDLFIQQERLIDAARDISKTTRTAKNTALTFGILIGKLNEKQLIIKKEFTKLFSTYADPNVQKIVDELFQDKRKRVR